jgi:hypothetical protein
MAYWPIRRRSIRLSGGLDSLLASNALCWSEETSAHLQKHVPPFITIYRLPFFAFQPFLCWNAKKRGTEPVHPSCQCSVTIN